MNTLEYLDSYSRRTADTRIVEIVERYANGTFLVRYIPTGAMLIASKANPADQFRLHSRVEVQDPAASRTVLGAMPVIVSRAPKEQKGLSETTPAAETRRVSRVSVIAIDPDPLELEAGGDAGQLVIVGSGFTVGPEFEAPGAAPDPDIIDEAAPVVTPTKITMQISADTDSPRGEFDAVVSGVRVKGALRVIDPRPTDPAIHVVLVAAAYSPDGFAGPTSEVVPVLYVLDADTLELLGAFEQVTFEDWDFTGGPVAVVGDVAYMVHGNNGGTADGSFLARANLRTLSDQGAVAMEVAPGDALAVRSAYSNMIALDGALVVDGKKFSDVEGESGLFVVTTAGEPARVFVTETSGGYLADDLDGSILTRKLSDAALYRTLTDDWSDNGAADSALDVSGAVRESEWTEEAGYGEPAVNVWATGEGDDAGKFFRLNAGTLATLETLVAGASPLGPPVQLRGSVFALNGLANLYRVVSGAVTDLGPLAAGPNYLNRIASDGEFLYVVGDNGVVRKLDFDGSTIATSDPLPFDGDLDLGDIIAT